MPTGVAIVVVGWVLSPIITDVIHKARSLAMSNYKRFKPFSKQLRQLVDVLEKTSETVQEVEKVQHRIGVSDGTKLKLVDSLHKVEDILDDFDYEDILLSNMAREHKVRQVAYSTVKKISSDKARLKEMLDELPMIQQSSRDLVQLLQFQASSSSSNIHADPTGPVLSGDELFFEYKEEYDELVSALLDDHPAAPSCSGGTGGNNRNTQVVAVIGHGGSGKTALAKRAWNDQRVQMGHFDRLIWASVSYKFSKDDLLTQIWKSMPGNRDRSAADMSFSSLQQEVLGLVASQRFLLVLDDVCNDESNDDGDDQMKKTWKDVLAPFRHGKQGSRILMTSRANICSKKLGAGTRITLNGVGTDDLVLLLKKSAFGNQHKDTPHLDDVITSVAEKLKGSPSAAATVAYKMRHKNRRADWLQLGYCNEITSIVIANKSSYHSLPRHLQSCLGFCSMFPDKWEFEPETLVKMWIAHGIISHNRSDCRSMEDVGREYIRNLHSRSFFKTTRQGKATFVIDEQIHLMLLSVCANYFFRIRDKRTSIPPTVRHLSVTDGCLAQLKKDPVLKQLRTLLVFGGSSAIDNDVLKGLKAVRVLGLASTSITDLPEGIGKLRHLRYLGLPSTVKSLPLAVTELLHLQTLALGKDCKLDHGFPADGMSSLINLRHLDMDMKYIAMMSGIGRLEKLQGSVEFCADRGRGHGMEELAGINSLRGMLSVKGLHAVANKEEAQKAQLGSKEFVKVLKLEWDPKLGRTCSTSSHEQVLEGLAPHCKIRELYIRRYQGTSSPSWLKNNLLASLGHLYLINCRNWKELPRLSELPDLRVLYIKEMLSVERIDHGSSRVFRSLEKLVLDDMPNLVEWTAESTDHIFPCLKEIYILNCPKLEKLPRIPATVRKVILENHNSYYLNLSVLKSNYFTLDIHGDAVQLLHEDFLHQHHIAAISALSIKNYTGTSEVTDRQLSMCLQRLQSLERLQISDC